MSDNKLFKNILKGCGLVIGACGLAYGGYLIKKSLEEKGITLKIKNIASSLAENNKAELDFKDLVKEDWNEMFIFPAYTSYEDIYSTLGFEWDEIYKTGISYKDDISLLVFVLDGKVVSYIEYPNEYGNFSELEKSKYYDGRFILYNSKNKICVKENF